VPSLLYSRYPKYSSVNGSVFSRKVVKKVVLIQHDVTELKSSSGIK
jgi:hypothetical protein